MRRLLAVSLVATACVVIQHAIAPQLDGTLIAISVILFLFSGSLAVGFAFLLGFLHDLYSPLFGVAFILYPILAWVGKRIALSVLTDRSPASFIALTLGIIVAFRLAQAIVYLLVGWLTHQTLLVVSWHTLGVFMLGLVADTAVIAVVGFFASRVLARHLYL